MNKNMKKAALILFGLLLLLMPGNAFAQLTTSSSISVNVNVTVSSSITLTQTGGNLVFSPATGLTNQITFSASWSLGPTSSISLYTWFSSPTAALSTGPANIPASQIASTWNSTDSNGSQLVCNTSPGVGNGVIDGASCNPILLASAGNLDLTTVGNNIGSRNTTFSLSILNFAAYKPTIAAGVYTGTLNALVLSI
jgi:hypothetical protein